MDAFVALLFQIRSVSSPPLLCCTHHPIVHPRVFSCAFPLELSLSSLPMSFVRRLLTRTPLTPLIVFGVAVVPLAFLASQTRVPDKEEREPDVVSGKEGSKRQLCEHGSSSPLRAADGSSELISFSLARAFVLSCSSSALVFNRMC
jgi:hypothetical protein